MKIPVLYLPRTEDQKVLICRLYGVGCVFDGCSSSLGAGIRWVECMSGKSDISASPYIYIDSKSICGTSFSQSTLDRIGKPGPWSNWIYVNSADQLVRYIAARS